MRKPTVQIAPWVFPLTEETASVPRMCGEKLSAVFTSCINLGSPPRVRGKGVPCSARRLGRGITPARAGKSVCGEKFIFVTTQISALRITPACAGKSKRGKPRFQRSEDHPRVCGEKSEWFEKDSRRSRITPACAGKRVDLSRTPKPAQDHPRVCGEKFSIDAGNAAEQGSPPRVRGKVVHKPHLPGHCGITPACAGKS